MNCLNCGAPTSPVAGRHYFYCGYCESHRPASRECATVDGVIASQETTDLNCPVCAGEPLLLAALDGAQVEQCGACRGVLMPNETFHELLTRRRREFDGPDDKPVPLNALELQRRLECPNCRATMDVHPYHGPGNAVIDTCFRCRLIWLDCGEFALMERAPGVR